MAATLSLSGCGSKSSTTNTASNEPAPPTPAPAESTPAPMRASPAKPAAPKPEAGTPAFTKPAAVTPAPVTKPTPTAVPNPAPASSTPSAAPTPAPTSSPATTVGAAGSKYDSGPRAGEQPVDEALAAVGAGVFTSKGCVTCHAFGKRLIGPDLKGVAMQRTALWMENQILHPEIMVKEDPIARQLLATYHVQMTNQKLTPDQARAVIEYIKKAGR
jgi:hypothetical protein